MNISVKMIGLNELLRDFRKIENKSRGASKRALFDIGAYAHSKAISNAPRSPTQKQINSVCST